MIVIKCFISMLIVAKVLANEDRTLNLGMSKANPGKSCNEIYQHNPGSRGTIDKYWIKSDEGLFEVTCNMKLNCGGVEGGWMQVVDVDMNRDNSCPETWIKTNTPRRLCLGYAPGCASAYFDLSGVSYEHICGQAKAYQKGSTDAFHRNKQSVDDIYVDGISITLGSPRKHVWTYAVGHSDGFDSATNCPCATHPGASPPAFVGNNYYCESGSTMKPHGSTYYIADPLWDGGGCGTGNGCCAQIGMPWFYRKLSVSMAENFEVRICKDQRYSDEDVALEKMELYVH